MTGIIFLKLIPGVKKHKIPEYVFVIIHPERINDHTDTELLKKLGRDDYKPQYINFSSPLLVSMFEKLCKKVPVNLRIEEMLPRPDQLLSQNEEQFVSEFVVQWQG